jgi:uncharacterized protein
MTLPGIVTNITAFGAFVDIGVHQDGLVHLSQLANKFIKDPNEVVKVHQQVEVTVTEVNVAAKRISLSMKKEEPKAERIPGKLTGQFKNPRGNNDMETKLAALKNKFS